MRDVCFVPDKAVLNLEFSRCGAHIDDLVRHLHELIEIKRAIVERTGQTKSIFNQHRFARAVAFVHATDLRDGGMRFIDHGEKIVREKVDNRVRL